MSLGEFANELNFWGSLLIHLIIVVPATLVAGRFAYKKCNETLSLWRYRGRVTAGAMFLVALIMHNWSPFFSIFPEDNQCLRSSRSVLSYERSALGC